MKNVNKISSSEYIAYIGLFSAFAIIISYIEALIPINIGIPGIKLGLPNVVIVMAIYLMDNKSGLIINLIRIIVVGMLFGNAFSILFSISGAVVSFIAMILLKKTKIFSILGVSVCGGVMHNVAQVLIAGFITDTYGINYYMPFMIIGGIITGVLIGILAMFVYNRCKNIFE